MQAHSLSDAGGVNPIADAGNGPGDLVAGNQRQRWHRPRPRLIVEIGPADPGCADLDQNVARPRNRLDTGGDEGLPDGLDLKRPHDPRLRTLATLAPVNERFEQLIAAASEKTVTVRSAEGHPMVRAKLLHAAAAAAAGVMLAPRLTAAIAVGALFKGVSLSLEEQQDRPVAA